MEAQIFAEVVFMGRTLGIFVLTVLWAGPHCIASAQTTDKNLIPVKPMYSEAYYNPQAQPDAANPAFIPTPSPRDQLYIFWIIGKALSYPIDKAESLIMSKLRKPRQDGIPTPAAASSAPNPFASVNWREIPPAPPASVR
ncbi:MAG: hypothetical protein NTW27_03220 [Deltaproteobacteria bacterium]|jgi:hypothetical protein|nr:hypothetical protein [Deltaproteobacteria bacterium]